MSDSSVTFDAQLGANWTWSNGDNTQMTTVSSAGEYSVILSDTNGCVSYDTINLSVRALPVFDLGNDTTICADSGITFDAKVGEVWDWSNGDNTQTTDVNTAGEYSVIVADEIGCTSYDTINLTIQALPIVDLGNDTVICFPNSITIDAGNWESFNWNTGHQTQSISPDSSGTYTVGITDELGCFGSDDKKLTVRSLPDVELGKTLFYVLMRQLI